MWRRCRTLLLAAERMGFDGLNITHPCKQAVLPLLTSLSDEARFLGAVNTVVLKDGERHGHNTDWWGFAEAFGRRMPDAPRRRVVQMGAGGAGAAGGVCGDDAGCGASDAGGCRPGEGRGRGGDAVAAGSAPGR